MWQNISSETNHLLPLTTHPFALGQKMYMCISGFSTEKTRYVWSPLHFVFIELFYIEIAFFNTFFSKFDNILLTIHNKMFRVGAKTWVGLGNLKHTYFFWGIIIIKNIWLHIHHSPAESPTLTTNWLPLSCSLFPMTDIHHFYPCCSDTMSDPKLQLQTWSRYFCPAQCSQYPWP